jgi:superfamily II RNA helicase
MKHEKGLNILQQRQLTRRTVSEAIELLDILLTYMFDDLESQKLREICSKWGDGMSWDQIAQVMNISPGEVRRYITIAEELCSSAIMACTTDEYVEQQTIFNDWEDMTVRAALKDTRTHTKYKKVRHTPLFETAKG